MKFNNIFFGLIIFFTTSCQEEKEVIILSTECAECIEYQYQQVYNDTFFVAVLNSGIYCLGDSAFDYTIEGDSQSLVIFDQELLDLMTQNGYCEFLVDTIIIE